MLQAVFFDLDGTLLQVDMTIFIREYLGEISEAMAPLVNPKVFAETLLVSTEIMAAERQENAINAEVFWADFAKRLGVSRDKLQPLLDAYYAHRFNNLAGLTARCDDAIPAVQKACDLGLKIVLATNPIFPEAAVRRRMEWAGVTDLPWELITTFENMHYSKPSPKYYLEIASQINVDPSRCLMVGNEVENDIIPARAVSMSTFLVFDGQNEHEAITSGTNGAGDLPAFILWLDDICRG